MEEFAHLRHVIASLCEKRDKTYQLGIFDGYLTIIGVISEPPKDLHNLPIDEVSIYCEGLRYAETNYRLISRRMYGYFEPNEYEYC